MTSADFAAAQKRVAERRAQREAAARQAHFNNSATVPSRLPPALHPAWRSLSSKWALIQGTNGTNPTFRVGQVDAELLDEELLELLKGQVGEALKYFGAHLQEDWSAEILASLRAVLFKLTIWDHDASYGAALQNLRYTDARNTSGSKAKPKAWQKLLYGLVSVGGRYGWTKWEDYLLDVDAGYDEPSPQIRRLSRLSQLASSAHSIASFASFLVFLFNGQYRTLLDRLLRLRLTPSSSRVSHEVSFEYLNRQLVWHAFTEFLLFLLPLVGISRWKRLVARTWRKIKAAFKAGADGDDEDGVKQGGELGFLPERTCAICYQDQNPTSTSETEVASITAGSSGVVGSASTDVTNPYEALPCGCIYCYVCIAQHLEAEDGQGWTCLRCGELVRECQPWNGDVEIVSSRPSSGKSVSFADDEEAEQADEKKKEDNNHGSLEESSFTTLDPIPVDEDNNNGAEVNGANKQESRESRREIEASVESIGNNPESSALFESSEWAKPGEDEDDEAFDLEAAQRALLTVDNDDDEVARHS